MEPREPKDRVSRRRMLKRIGAGAAIAWTTPILTSIRTPAFAASPACGPFDCSNPAFGSCTCASGAPGVLTHTPAGGCVCILGGGIVETCDACTPPFVCVELANCGPGNTLGCAPLC
jgi:hypothetical protein